MPYLGGVGLEIAVVGHATVGERAALTGGKLEASRAAGVRIARVAGESNWARLSPITRQDHKTDNAARQRECEDEPKQPAMGERLRGIRVQTGHVRPN
jgi:hypothetical protein